MAKDKLDKLIKRMQDARKEDLAKPAVRLSKNHRHYKTTTTSAERDMRKIERINRNAPVVRTTLKAILWQEIAEAIVKNDSAMQLKDLIGTAR